MEQTGNVTVADGGQTVAPNRLKIQVSENQIDDFCKKNHVQKLSFFGSVLTERFSPQSDVDVLVEFESGKGPGLFDLSGMEIELSRIIGRKVDLRTAGELSRYFRSEVIAGAQVQYDRAA